MTKISVEHVLSQLRIFNEQARANGGDRRQGVDWLNEMLLKEQDADNRYFIYQILIEELMVLNCRQEVLSLAEQRLHEFKDILSTTTFASALFHVGRASEGWNVYTQAFLQAAQTGEMLNYTFGEVMREAVRQSNIEVINKLSGEMLSIDCMDSHDDCVLETDWMDKAEALGADVQLIRELRKRA